MFVPFALNKSGGGIFITSLDVSFAVGSDVWFTIIVVVADDVQFVLASVYDSVNVCVPAPAVVGLNLSGVIVPVPVNVPPEVGINVSVMSFESSHIEVGPLILTCGKSFIVNETVE